MVQQSVKLEWIDQKETDDEERIVAFGEHLALVN
jgi:hypothetical protein